MLPGPKGRTYSQWHCLCDCGATTVALMSKLKGGSKKSCGCLQRTGIIARTTTHGQSGTGLYRIWAGIKKRCNDPTYVGYERYGGRGIAMCDEWSSDFVAFARDMGPRPSPQHSVERSNNDLGYSPSNCYWGTKVEQANNMSSNVKYLYQGQELTLPQISRLCGVHHATIFNRLKVGRPLSEAADPHFDARSAGRRQREMRRSQAPV